MTVSVFGFRSAGSTFFDPRGMQIPFPQTRSWAWPSVLVSTDDEDGSIIISTTDQISGLVLVGPFETPPNIMNFPGGLEDYAAAMQSWLGRNGTVPLDRLRITFTEGVQGGVVIGVDFSGSSQAPAARTVLESWTWANVMALDPVYDGDGSGSQDQALTGTDGNDTLTGGIGDDTIDGQGGNNRLDGAAGDDRILGGDGRDTIFGGDGDDLVFGGRTSADLRDVIFGGDGNDTIYGGFGNDEIRGDGDNDLIFGEAGADTLIGGAGNDTLNGGALGDMLFGGPGDDFLNGGFGFDRLNGGAGADTFFHLGVADHGSDWIQDYNAADGDVLQIGIAGATRAQFQVNIASTPNAGAADVAEAFVIYRPSGQIIWALVDGAGQDSINLRIGGEVFDLLG